MAVVDRHGKGLKRILKFNMMTSVMPPFHYKGLECGRFTNACVADYDSVYPLWRVKAKTHILF